MSMRSLARLLLAAPTAHIIGAGFFLAAVPPMVAGAEAETAQSHHVPILSHTSTDIQIITRSAPALVLRGQDALGASVSMHAIRNENRWLKEDNMRDDNEEGGVADCDKDCQKALKKAKKDEEKALKKAEKEAAKAAEAASQESAEIAEVESAAKENVFIENVSEEQLEEVAVEDLNHSAATPELHVVREPELEPETTPMDTTSTRKPDDIFSQEMPNSSQSGIRGMTPGGKFGISLVFIALFALVVVAAFQLHGHTKSNEFRVGIPWKKMNKDSDGATKNDPTFRTNGSTDINTSTDTNSGLHKELDDLVEYLQVVEAATEDTDICAFEEGEGFEVWS